MAEADAGEVGPIVARRQADDALEEVAEGGWVGVPDLRCDLTDGTRRGREEVLGAPDSLFLDESQRGLAGVGAVVTDEAAFAHAGL